MTREQFIGELARLTMLAFYGGMSKKSCKLLAKVHKHECDMKERDDEARRIRDASAAARFG